MSRVLALLAKVVGIHEPAQERKVHNIRRAFRAGEQEKEERERSLREISYNRRDSKSQSAEGRANEREKQTQLLGEWTLTFEEFRS